MSSYQVILADPPWSYKVFSKKGEARGAVSHYPTMKIADIKALPVADWSAKDCHLFMWTTGPNLFQALEVMEAWGFKFSSMAFTWVKLNPREKDAIFFFNNSFHVGMGHTTRKNCEFCLLGRKGSPKRLSKSVRELLIAPRREHSRKPDETYTRIEQYAEGPYLEMFARQRRAGWDAWGNDVDKFGVAAE